MPFQGLWQKRPSLSGISDQSDSQLAAAGQTFAALTVIIIGIVVPMPTCKDILLFYNHCIAKYNHFIAMGAVVDNLPRKR